MLSSRPTNIREIAGMNELEDKYFYQLEDMVNGKSSYFHQKSYFLVRYARGYKNVCRGCGSLMKRGELQLVHMTGRAAGRVYRPI